MNDNYTEVLTYYDLEVREIRRGRGAWLCGTDRGLKLLREYRGTVKRLEFENDVLNQIVSGGDIDTDLYVRNREGNLITVGEDGTRWILKNWYEDRECSLKDTREVLRAVEKIGELHKALQQVENKEEWNLGSILQPLPDREMERHNREMTRARAFIRKKRKKTELELCIMESFALFFQQAREAEEGMRKLLSQREIPSCLCHGDLNQHHILMCRDRTAVVEFSRMHYGIQMEDLYHFMRKAMEKHDWDKSLGMAMLETYSKILPFSQAEKACLYYLFLYPEKYWKQINFYYNSNKSWLPSRNVEKLKELEQQQPARMEFLEKIK